jgi:hypothetical protein
MILLSGDKKNVAAFFARMDGKKYDKSINRHDWKNNAEIREKKLQ